MRFENVETNSVYNPRSLCYNIENKSFGGKMNVYDFDGTIYRGDSSVDFYLFCLRRHPSVLARFPSQAAAFFRYRRKKCNKTAMKQVFFSYLAKISDLDAELCAFWASHEKNIFPYYIEQKRSDDVIISASPEFLLAPICEKLGVPAPIGSRVDRKTGEFSSKNCHDTEKVARFREIYGDAEIERFYSDSRSDSPLAFLAGEAFFVKKGTPEPWGEIDPEELVGEP